MSFWETIMLAIALGTDAFSVAIVCGIQQFSHKNILKISVIIAVFHIIMPVLGAYGGHIIQDLLIYFFGLNRSIDHILSLVGSGLLMIIGFYMVIEKWLNREEELCNFNIKGWGMFVLAFSVSIDSLSVGISLGMLGHISTIITLIIGLTAGIMMASGLYFGSKLGHFIGEEAQVFGGLGLIALGLHFVGVF